MADGGRVLWGGKGIAFGSKLIEWGAPLEEMLIQRPTPEQVLVACARSMCLPPFPVFEDSGDPTLPSMVYAAAGADELQAFERTMTTQTFVVSIRAKDYGEVVECARDYYHKLRAFPGGRIRGVGGFTDIYADSFNFRVRTMQVTIQV